MPLTTLDPRTALIVIDLQKGVVALPTVQPIAAILANARALADAFRERGLPVVLVNVAGVPAGRTEQTRSRPPFAEGWTELAPELDARPDDIRVTKQARGAFANTRLEAQLKALGVTQVVIIGVSTTAGVESTARQAFDLGFNVTVALDAVTDMDPDAHSYAVEKVFPRLGETGSSQDVINLLGKA